MLRFVAYLGALVANTALVFFAFDWIDGPTSWLAFTLLAAAAPVLVLRLGSLTPALLAPPAIVVLALAGMLASEALGADCARSGMDYLNTCNGAASAGMVFMFGGFYALEISVLALVLALLVRGARRLILI